MVARLGGRDLGLGRHVDNHRQARRENGETSQQNDKEAQALHNVNFVPRRRPRKSRFGHAGGVTKCLSIYYFEYSGNTV
jgi:hypothetical protein